MSGTRQIILSVALGLALAVGSIAFLLLAPRSCIYIDRATAREWSENMALAARNRRAEAVLLGATPDELSEGDRLYAEGDRLYNAGAYRDSVEPYGEADMAFVEVWLAHRNAKIDSGEIVIQQPPADGNP